jgi:hypothetical protein
VIHIPRQLADDYFNWRLDVTGAEMIRSAYRLLLGENDFSDGGPALPSRHSSSIAEQIGGKRRRFFLDVDAQGVLIGLVYDQLITATIVIEYSRDKYIHSSPLQARSSCQS